MFFHLFIVGYNESIKEESDQDDESKQEDSDASSDDMMDSKSKIKKMLSSVDPHKNLLEVQPKSMHDFEKSSIIFNLGHDSTKIVINNKVAESAGHKV